MEWAGVVAGVILLAALGVSAALLAGRRGWTPRHRGAGSAGTLDRGVAPTTAPQDGHRAELAGRALDSLRVGVVVLDPDDHPALANPSARAMGLLRAGAGAGTVVAHPMLRSLAGQVRRAGVRREVELDLPRGGTADPLGLLLRAVGLSGGYVAVEAADVTESHRVARVRRDFVANVGHELKTPIGALQLLAEALLDATGPAASPGAAGRGPDPGAPGPGPDPGAPGPGPDPGAAAPGPASTDLAQDVAAARRFAERIQQESARLGRLVTELLELTRLQGADPLPEPVPVSLDAVVAEAVDRVRTGAAARDIRLTVVGQRGLTGYGNDHQLATAVANLAENAVAYSPEGSDVAINLRDEGEWLAIEVTDRGIGIPVEDLDRIFERFYRSDRARSRATGGTGLGLAIVKHIATNHGGRVEVTSAPGQGSTFTFRLPARPLADARRSLSDGGIGSGAGNGAGAGAPAPASGGGAGR